MSVAEQTSIRACKSLLAAACLYAAASSDGDWLEEGPIELGDITAAALSTTISFVYEEVIEWFLL